MDISVIVPIYNVEKYIEECLVSLFEQTKTDGVEFILVNDCTPDNSMNIVRRVIVNYPNLTVKIIEHKVNRGLPVARRSGIEVATGEYIQHFDSDDWCELEMLEELYKEAKETDADILCSDGYKNSESSEVYLGTPHFSKEGIKCAEFLLDGKLTGHLWRKFIKRSLYVDNKISITEGINMGEDVLHIFQLFCLTSNVHYLPKAFYHYRNNTDSITHNIDLKRTREYFISIPIEIDKFVIERKLNNMLDDVIIRRKLTAKLETITSVSYHNRKEFANIHPEVNEYIPTMTQISPIVRFGLKQATKGRLYVFNIIQIVSKIKKKLNIKKQISK